MAEVVQAGDEVLGVGYDIVNDIIFEIGFWVFQNVILHWRSSAFLLTVKDLQREIKSMRERNCEY